MRRNVEQLAVVALRQPMHFDPEVINERFHLRAPRVEVRGGDLQGGDAVVVLGAGRRALGGLQFGEPLVQVGGDLGAGVLEDLEPLVDDGGTLDAGLVEIGEAVRPLLLVGVESAVEVVLGLLDLLQDELQLWIHGTEGTTEASEVVVVNLVGFQRGSGKAIRYQL